MEQLLQCKNYRMFLMQNERLEWSSNPTLGQDPCRKQIKFYSYQFEYKTCNFLFDLWIHPLSFWRTKTAQCFRADK